MVTILLKCKQGTFLWVKDDLIANGYAIRCYSDNRNPCVSIESVSIIENYSINLKYFGNY